MARWSQRTALKTRASARPRWTAERMVAYWNVAYIDGFDGFACGCAVDEDVRYMACMTCGSCEECCTCTGD